MTLEVTKSVVRITSTDEDNSRFGTGFVIYQDDDTQTAYLLTCAHVIRDIGGKKRVQVLDHHAEVVAYGSEDGPDDLAVLRVGSLFDAPLKLGPSEQRNSPFVTAGFEELKKNNYVVREIRGYLGGQVGLETRGQTDRITAWDLEIKGDRRLQHGYSGSPVVDEMSGLVLGVVSYRLGAGEKGLAISVEAVKQIWPEMPLELMNEPLRTPVTIGDVELSVLVAGPETGKQVVLLHGIATGAELWRTTVKDLGAAGFRAYAPDMPGYGLTRMPDGGDYSLDGATELISSWLRSEDISPVWIVGHNIGGYLALMLAERFPVLIERLTLCNMFAGGLGLKSFELIKIPFRLRFGMFLLKNMSVLILRSPTIWSLMRKVLDVPNKTTDDTVRRVFFDTKVSDPKGRSKVAVHFSALSRPQSIGARHLLETGVPTLLVWGEEDSFESRGTIRILEQQLHPKPESVPIRDSGHYVMLDKPKDYVKALLEWAQAQ